MSEYRDYENGVADVLGFLAGDDAVVERNVRVMSRSSGRRRQIDVVVRNRIGSVAEVTVVVDCKCWASPVDVKAVESFIAMVDDVVADVGLIVTTNAVTTGARQRAASAGIRLRVMTLNELRSWGPPGTVTVTYRVPATRQGEAERALRNAGFRVVAEPWPPTSEDEAVLAAFRHYATSHPDEDIQREHQRRAGTALQGIGIDAVTVSQGVTAGGGTPAHRWLEVAMNEVPIGLKVLAATEAEADDQLDNVAQLGMPRSVLSVIRPTGWPDSTPFELWGASA